MDRKPLDERVDDLATTETVQTHPINGRVFMRADLTLRLVLSSRVATVLLAARVDISRAVWFPVIRGNPDQWRDMFSSMLFWRVG
jgi:hypothetical protein